jgi:uncharacterized membrane protein (UPF0182 family)
MINQDPVISAQLALWNQQGSNVIRGNLLVIPVAGSLMYVEPLYLQAATGQIPELQRVIVATANDIVMSPNLGLALVDLFGRAVLAEEGVAELATFSGEATVPVTETAQSSPEEAAGSLEALIEQANVQFAQAQEAARTGDWAGYGQAIDQLEATLEALAAAVAGS